MMSWIALLFLQAGPDHGRWVDELDAPEIQMRERAEQRLLAAGEAARGALQRAAAKADEAGLRARRILRWLEFTRALPPFLLQQEPGLQAALLHPSPDIRRKALFSPLPGKLGGYRPSAALCRIALQDPDLSIRLEAAIKIPHDLTGAASKAALDFLLNHDRPEYAALCGDNFNSFVWDARSRVSRGRHATTEEVLPLLESPASIIRASGIEILADHRRWEAIPQVRSLLRDRSPDVVREAIQYLEKAGQLGEPRTYLDLVRTGPKDAVYYAAGALRTLRAVESASELADLAWSQGDVFAASGLLDAAAALDPKAAEPVAVHVLRESVESKADRPIGPDSTALEVLARLGKSEHLDLILEALRKRASYRFVNRLVDGDELKFFDNLSRCVAVDRYPAVIDLCNPHERTSSAFAIHGDRNLLGSVGSSLAYRLRNREFRAAALRRALDPSVPGEKRSAACNALRWHEIPPEDAAPVMEALARPDAPLYLLSVIPWGNPGTLREPLREFCERVLQERKSPLKDALLTRLWYEAEVPLKTLALRALEEDDRLPIPHMIDWYSGYLPSDVDLSRLVAKRLASPDSFVVMSILHAEYWGHPGLFRDAAKLLNSPDASVRSTAMEKIDWSSHREELRRAVAQETTSTGLVRCLDAVAALRDRPGLDAALGRNLNPGSPEELARVKAIAAVGTPAELLALEPRLQGLSRDILVDLLPALARADRAAGHRFLPWALVHSDSPVRVGAVRSIGELRSTEHLRALSAMALFEAGDVVGAARKALLVFDEDVWLPVYREALWGETDAAVFQAITSKQDPRLASDLRTLVRQGSYAGAMAAQALDAMMNPGAHRRWSGVGLGEDERPVTLRVCVRALERAGIPVQLSGATAAWIDHPLRCWTGGALFTLTQAIGHSYVQGERGWIFFGTLSGPEGVRILTLEEADGAWREAFERR